VEERGKRKEERGKRRKGKRNSPSLGLRWRREESDRN